MTRSHFSARRDLWSIVGAATLWGTTGVSTQAIYQISATNALSVAFLRLAIGALALLLLCSLLLGKRMWIIKKRDTLVMVFMGALQAIFQFSYLAAIPLCGVTIATLIAICVAPVLVVLYSAIVLRERITRKMMLALFCALLGTVLLTGTPTTGRPFAQLLLGVALSLLSAAGYAAVILAGRVVSGRYHTLQINAVVFGIGALLLLASSFTTHLVLSYPVNAWLLLFYMGCIPTALAYILFQSGLRSVSATLTSILTLSEPLTAALLAWLLFGERLSLPGIVGGGLLLGTILLLAYNTPAKDGV